MTKRAAKPSETSRKGKLVLPMHDFPLEKSLLKKGKYVILAIVLNSELIVPCQKYQPVSYLPGLRT